MAPLFRFVHSHIHRFGGHSFFVHVSVLVVEEIVFILLKLLLAEVWVSTIMTGSAFNFSTVTLLCPEVAFLILVELKIIMESIGSLLVAVDA